ncbi:hypothetical protein Tco_0822212 [Tanacetum coccineum]|uniref:Uncharacterized protein n=1 Tax=Tanacetum coccineum TaxID=301880 RepID=A0ABQ5AFD2_9ASTR
MFQRLGRYPTSVRVFPDPILFLNGLQSSWEHGQQRPVILVGGKGTSSMLRMRKIYLFFPNEPSLGFGTGSPYVLVNIEPLRVDEEPVLQPAEVMTDLRGSPKPELPPMERKLASGSLNSHATHAKTSTLKDDVPFLTVFDDDEDATSCHLKIYAITPPAWKNHLDNHIDVELLDLHDRCYARLSTLESQIASIEAEKARLEAVEVSIQKEGSLVGRIVSSAIFYGRCKAFEQVAGMKEPFDLSKTQALVASSPKATPPFVLGSNPTSPLADASVVKPLGKGLRNFQSFAKIREYSFLEMLFVFRADCSWYSKSAHYIFPYKPFYMSSAFSGKGLCFYPFLGVFYGYCQEFKAFESCAFSYYCGEGVTATKIDEITTTSAPTTAIDEITLAQTLIEIKAAKPKVVTTASRQQQSNYIPNARWLVVQEPSEFKTTTSSPQASQPSKTKDKDKVIMIKPKVPLKKKDQVALDEEITRNLEAQLQAKLIEEERLADRLLAERLQTREQEELTDEEKAKLFIELMEKRRKHFAALRAQEKRNRPPTKTQKINQMSIYLKHMGGYKHNQLKGRSYEEIKKLFDKEMKRVNSFMAMNSEAQEISGKKDESSSKKAEIAQDSSTKRAGDKLESDKSKKQKTNENEEFEVHNEAELKKLMVIVKDDDIAIDVIPLATKPPVIIKYKLIREGIIGHYQLIRANWTVLTEKTCRLSRSWSKQSMVIQGLKMNMKEYCGVI